MRSNDMYIPLWLQFRSEDGIALGRPPLLEPRDAQGPGASAQGFNPTLEIFLPAPRPCRQAPASPQPHQKLPIPGLQLQLVQVADDPSRVAFATLEDAPTETNQWVRPVETGVCRFSAGVRRTDVVEVEGFQSGPPSVGVHVIPSACRPRGRMGVDSGKGQIGTRLGSKTCSRFDGRSRMRGMNR